MDTSIVEATLTVEPGKIKLSWKMAIAGGVFVFPMPVLQVRLYCQPFPEFGAPHLIYPPLSRVQHTQTRGVEGSVVGVLGGAAGWEITREAFRPGAPTEPAGERYGYYPLDLHLDAIRLTTNDGNVHARVEWSVENDWMASKLRCWATFGYITPGPGSTVGDYTRLAESNVISHDPGAVPEPVTVIDPARAPYVFLSYQRDSEAEAALLRAYLQKAGFRVWQDVENIRHGDIWIGAIDQALRETDRLLLLETPKAMESQGVFTEWFFYYEKRKPIHRLILETCEPNAALLPYQYLDWRDPSKRDWERLMQALQAEFTTPALALKERVINVDFAPERTLPEALQALKGALLADTGVVALRGDQLDAIKTHKPADETEFRLARYAEWCGPRYQLDERFVRLTMYIKSDQGWQPKGETRRFTDLRDILVEEPAHTLVLLGDPGAGKSTLLRRLEMDIAHDALRDESVRTLTFYIPLSEYGLDTPAGEPLPRPIDWLGEKWRIKYPDLPPLEDLLRERRVVLLLDSLNEMPHTDRADFEKKAALWRAFIYDWVRDQPGNRAIFACRTLDYGAVLSTDEHPVPQIQLEPMTPREVRDYLTNYAPEYADLIWESFEREPRLFGLFRIPFMLKLLVDRVKLDGRIPQGRAETFNGFVYTLLVRELGHRNPLFDRSSPLLSPDEHDLLRALPVPPDAYYLPEEGLLIPALTGLAYIMQEREPGEDKGQVTVKHTEALKLLPVTERQRDIVRAGCAINVLDRLDLLYLRYYHQLLQEFFAARQLARQPRPDLVHVEWHVAKVTPTLQEELERIADSDPLPLLPGTGWEETTVLAAAMSPDPNAFVHDLMEANLPLAARCAAAPDVNVRDDLCDDIRRALIARTQDPDADLRARIAAGLALGEIGDPRFERCTGSYGDYLLPPLIPIDGGEYTLGSDDGLYDDEKPVHPVPIAPFEMGQFPVTNAEYALFIAAGGYEDEQWWETDAAKAWQQGEGNTEGQKASWRETRTGLQSWSDDRISELVTQNRITSEQAEQYIVIRNMPEDEFERQLEDVYPAGKLYRQPEYWDNTRFNNPAQPVVGVSWFEARAYCAWISAQTGQQFRLPTEAEWEAAARGKTSRRFAYSGDFDAALCNTFETHIRGTTPVGVFPGGKTPEGLVDMTGNVWDWTSTIYQPYPYRTDDGREDVSDAAARRVVRGGSWNGSRDFARCACRRRTYPLYRPSNIGFRILRVPHL